MSAMHHACCPQCGSEQTQRISVLISAQTTEGSYQGSSLSFSTGGGLGVGSHIGQTRSRSELARRFIQDDPPSNFTKELAGGIAVLLVTAIAGFAIQSWKGLGPVLAFAGLGVFLLFLHGAGRVARQRALDAWHWRKTYLEHAWFCHRCGHDWRP